MKIFLDTNIILDTLLPDRKSRQQSLQIIGLHKQKDIRLHISSLSIANIAFCARKYATKEELHNIINRIYLDFKILPLSSIDVSNALESGCPDYEDALQISVAEPESEIIVTGNKKHFSQYTSLPVYTPQEFLDKLLLVSTQGKLSD